MGQENFDVAKAIATTMGRNLEPYTQGARAFELKGELWVFVDDPAVSTPELLKDATEISQKPPKVGLRAVHYVLPHWAPSGEEWIILGLGLTAETVRMALRRLLDLPSTFDASQQLLINETLETELLFLALFLRLLKPGGRAAVIVPDGVLFGSSKAHKTLRQMLVEEQKLDAIYAA